MAPASTRSRRGPLRGVAGFFRGVPERFGKPRILLVSAVFALAAFGVLMVFSASSASNQLGQVGPMNDLRDQLLFSLVGIVLAVILIKVDYHYWSETFLPLIWLAVVVLLVLCIVNTPLQVTVNGASRWVKIGPLPQMQPSEFEKVVVVLTTATICKRYFEDDDYSFQTAALALLAGVGVPLTLILLEPDNGSTLICVVGVVSMLYLSGMSGKLMLLVGGTMIALVFVLFVFTAPYALARVLTFLNPESDPSGSAYQQIQGFYAFGSGGLFGVGIGMGAQKYNYLPMAKDDFILATIGEECGLVGTLAVVAAFAIIIWSGYRIARYAPDLAGRAIAGGATTMLGFQTFVNMGGVLGVMPLTGKPLPFLSSGGSSVISCFALVGLILSVSNASHLDETEGDRRRRQLVEAPRTDARGGYSYERDGRVGEPTRRSQRDTMRERQRTSASARSQLRLVDDDERQRTSRGERREAQRREVMSRARTTVDPSGHTRLDLGPSAAERLRQRGHKDR